MGIILDLLIDMLEDIRQSQNNKKQQVLNKKGVVPSSITSTPKIQSNTNRKESSVSQRRNTVNRNITPLWQERKWSKSGSLYLGYYRTPYGAYKGEIVEQYQGYGRYYIFNPPSCLSRHSHYACFIPKGGNKYEVHFSEKANNVDEGIMAIEKILAEAHRL